jgi:hypothetical protein
MANTNTPGAFNQRPPVTVGNTSTGGSSGGSGGGSTGNTSPGGSGTGSTTPTTPLILTKFQFRKLFTTSERMAIDNAKDNPNLSSAIKNAVFTLQKDLEVSAEVDLHLKDTIDGVHFLVNAGLVTAPRAARILANLMPL